MTGMSVSPRSRHAGFTLLELIVSICVLAILTAIAAPSLAPYLNASAPSQPPTPWLPTCPSPA